MTAVLDRVEIANERGYAYRSPEVKNEYKKYDIWMVEMREGRGKEQRGNRPAIVISNNIGNLYSPVLVVAPLTTSTTKAKMPTHVKINASESGLEYDSVILMEQPVTLDKSRLKYKICSIDGTKAAKYVDKALNVCFGL